MEKRYFLKKEKITLGPFTLNKLKEKQLKSSDLVWHDGLSDWTPSGNLAEFQTGATTLTTGDERTKFSLSKFLKNLFFVRK
jgi:hypothetical protein